jgi:DNA mismatch repair protein MutH
MKIEKALPILDKCIDVKFGDLFSDLPSDLRINKGNVGQLLLLKIGLKLDSKLTDFEDGELKTNKSDSLGLPLETMFITQISSIIDTLVSKEPLEFTKSNIYRKIKRLVFLPVCKESDDVEDWFFVSRFDYDLEKEKNLKKILEKDYYEVCKKLKLFIENSKDGFIHTSSGKFIQIRSKDSKPYSPIFSGEYNRNISNKNHAFYFKKDFMRYVQSNIEKTKI